MPGFCVKIGSPSSTRLADTAADNGETSGTFFNAYASAKWEYITQTTQHYLLRLGNRILFVDGQPDRFPQGAESLEDWLVDRWGSFRGFEITDETVTVFVDPLSTRPVFVFAQRGEWCAADKLATISANVAEAEVNWPAVLEAAAIGSVQMPGETTLTGTRQLKAGECVRIDLSTGQVHQRFYRLPSDDLREAVRSDANGTLLDCIGRAVTESWRDKNTWLMISGGLDSRLTMALAGHGRSAITINYYDAETPVARTIAETCGAADFRVFHLPELFHADMIRNSTLMTGAMYDPNFVNFYGLGGAWRAQGITSVVHAFLFDTVLKGWLMQRVSDIAPVNVLGGSFHGVQALLLSGIGRGTPYGCVDVAGALTQDGAEVLRQRFKNLSDVVPSVIEDGVETGVERHVLSHISRQVHFGFLLGLYGEVDVVSPIFHPAIWNWYHASTVFDRWQGRAIRAVLRGMDHPVKDVPDSNTGMLVTEAGSSWSDRIRRNTLYRALIRPIWKRLHSRTGVKIESARWFSNEESRHAIEEGIHFLEGNPLINPAVGLRYLAQFKAGDDRYLTPALALMNAGRWHRLVKERAAQSAAR